MILETCGLSRSGCYKALKSGSFLSKGQGAEAAERERKKSGRPLPGYSLNGKGEKASDSFIRAKLKKYRERAAFYNWGGYKVLSRYFDPI